MEQQNIYNLTITTTAIATLIASIIASLVSFLLYRFNSRRDEKKRLDECLFKLNSYYLQYPYLENDEFIKDWEQNKENSNEKYQRYDAYCTMIFNFLSDLCFYCNFKKEKIEKLVYIKEYIHTHANWWKNPLGKYSNIEAYSEKFREFINKYLY